MIGIISKPIGASLDNETVFLRFNVQLVYECFSLRLHLFDGVFSSCSVVFAFKGFAQGAFGVFDKAFHVFLENFSFA